MNYRRIGLLGLLLAALVGPVLVVSKRSAQRSNSAIAAAQATSMQKPSGELSYYLSLPIDRERNARAITAAQRAVELGNGGQLQAAQSEYERAMELMPALGDWLSLFAAGAAATLGDTAAVNRRAVGLDSALVEDWLWRARLRAYRNAEDRRGSMRLARGALEPTSSARRSAEAWRAIAELELASADTSAARTAFTNTLAAWPYSDIALDAARQLAQLPGLNADQELQIGRIYLRFGNSERGLEGMRKYVRAKAAHPDTAQRVTYEIGRHHFEAGRYAEAVRVLTQVTTSNGVGAEALLLRARALHRNDQQALGRATFTRVAERYPNTEVGARALFMLGDLEQDAGKLDAAVRSFRRAAASGRRSEPAGIAHMRLVTIALSRRDSAAAIAQLEKYRSAFAGSAREQQARYWLGRLHSAADRDTLATSQLTAAAEANPLSYYGIRAADLLADGESSFRFAPDPVTDSATQKLVEAALVRLDALYSIGWTEAAAYEVRRLRDYFTGNVMALYSLAEGLNQRGRTSIGIAMGNELMRSLTGPTSRRLLRTVYPFPHRELIVREAQARGIDPYFMAALIRQESAFNPKATSGAGAMGLMQVMPPTARGVARSLGIRSFSAEMLHQPEVNVRIGSHFLADVMQTWGGRTDFVLAAYNAGPSRMARWRRFPEARDRDLFMERIPFDETRDYVRVVQLNTRIYGMLYGSGQAASQDRN